MENNLAWLGREVVCVNINIPESTAQGGGGRIRNRKPIGEIGYCESRMAEQKHWWIQLSNCNWLTD